MLSEHNLIALTVFTLHTTELVTYNKVRKPGFEPESEKDPGASEALEPLSTGVAPGYN